MSRFEEDHAVQDSLRPLLATGEPLDCSCPLESGVYILPVRCEVFQSACNDCNCLAGLWLATQQG